MKNEEDISSCTLHLKDLRWNMSISGSFSIWWTTPTKPFQPRREFAKADLFCLCTIMQLRFTFVYCICRNWMGVEWSEWSDTRIYLDWVVVLKDRLCPTDQHGKTRGGCACVQPGGSPGLPTGRHTLHFCVRSIRNHFQPSWSAENSEKGSWRARCNTLQPDILSKSPRRGVCFHRNIPEPLIFGSPPGFQVKRVIRVEDSDMFNRSSSDPVCLVRSTRGRIRYESMNWCNMKGAIDNIEP